MIRYRLIAAVAMAMAVVFGISAKTMKKENTFAAPDFAFPQTVEKNAGAALKTALRNGDAVTALQAAIQTTAARNIVSNAGYAENIALFDSLARVLPAPYGNLALLLEARIYGDIYTSERWKFNARELPEGDAPENVMEWNRGLFASKITELTERTMKETGNASSMPLTALKTLVYHPESAVSAGMSVLDFMTFRAVDLLSPFADVQEGETIPFGGEDAAVRNAPLYIKYIAEAIARNASSPEAESVFRQMMLSHLSGDAYDSYLKECTDRYYSTPWCAQFLSDWNANMTAKELGVKTDNEARRIKLTRLRDYLAAYPQARNIGLVQRAIDRLQQKTVNVEFPSSLLPGREGKGSITAENLYDLTLLVYSIPDSYVKARSSKPVYYSTLSSVGSRVAAIPVRLEGSTPDKMTAQYEIPALKPGVYTIVASTDGRPSGIVMKESRSALSLMTVSDLTAVAFTSKEGDGSRSLYVMDAATGAPVQGAKVTFTSTRYGDGTVETALTDAKGCARTRLDQFSFVAEKEGNFTAGSRYLYDGNREDRGEIRGDVLTDLSLVRPGQELAFAAVAYRREGHRLSALEDADLSLVVRNASYQDVDTLRLRTDRFGRCEGKLTIPGDGMLGSWTLLLIKDDNTLGMASVDVAEYKAPTFFVDAESARPAYTAGDTITVKGKAMTYAGMPVAGGKVKYMVTYTPVWWWRSGGETATYGGETESGADGSFEISLPTGNLRGTRFCCGRYDIRIDVTDAAGETQQVSVPFSMGDAYSIRASLPRLADISGAGDVTGSVTVRDAIGRPAVKTVYYTVMRDGAAVASGSFESPAFTLATAGMQPGRYRVLFSLDRDAIEKFTSDSDDYDGEAQVEEAEIVLYRPADSRPPVETALWTTGSEIIVPEGEKEVSVPVGSSYAGSRILVEISDDRKVLSREWISRDGVIEPLKVKAPARDGRVFVTFVAVHDFSVSRETVTLVPSFQKEQLSVETVTFRDRVEPGARESWKFRFTFAGKPCGDIPVMAVMTDKSLNAISPFSWSLNPYGILSWSRPGNVTYDNILKLNNNASVALPSRKNVYDMFRNPEWNLYGQSLYRAKIYVRGTRMMKTSAAINSANVVDEMKEESADADAFYSVEEAPAMTGADDLPKAREKEHPLAFFMPSLATDDEGYVEIPFTAPDFVGTWQFQIAGYNRDMKGTAEAMDAVSSKKVMAQLNAPRFVRTGDRVAVTATLWNNSDAPLQIAGRMVVADASTGTVLVSADEEAVTVAPSASRTVSIELAAPSDLSMLTVSAYALADGSSDGEMVQVPVLPSSTPVVETKPFWLAPGDAVESVKLPRYDKDAKVTLQYCSNPAWECVTALPGITRPASVNLLSRIEAYYATSLAAGLFNKYPALSEGIRVMADPANAADSTLVSPLQKNASLKTVALKNTPWVNSAAAETARMQSLLEYADPANAAEATATLLKQIGDARNADGGWSWCPDMPSSEYITERVLTIFADLSRLGFAGDLPSGWVKKGFSYCDNELAKDWERSERKYFSVTGLLDYLYAKSAFAGVGATSRFAPLEKAAVKEIASGWRDFDIYHKATAAMLLAKRGDVKTASLILESLRQFASTDAAKGTWFDNLGSSWNGAGKLLTTARVLRAYAALQPDNGIVDGLRQWLVLSKQTEDWGGSGALAEVTGAILDSGTDWTARTVLPEITLGGKPVDPGHAAKLTGAFTVTLPAGDASGKTLEVRKTGDAPSWGGVVSQYVAPIRDVKAAEIPELSIRKALYSLTPGKEGYEVTDKELHTGDRVRVTLFITTDRDMDYVAVTDSRAACLEPADQLSAYTSSDGVFFYREVRNESTNLFIPFLPKGTHVVSYDCFVDRAGECSLGIATAQSQYAPVITAHSAGKVLKIEN